MIHDVAYFLGLTNANSFWYLWWSGVGSLILTAGIFGIVWKFLNCHESSCKRIGMYHVPGTPFRTCKEHHPAIDETKDITAEHIRKAHHRWLTP